MNYQKKYIKYKNKYLNLKKNMLQRGGGLTDGIPVELFDHISLNIIKKNVIAIKKELIHGSALNKDELTRMYQGYNFDRIQTENIEYDNHPS